MSNQIEKRYFDLPYPELAFYHGVSNKIYLHNIVKEYPNYEQILIDHEMQHYENARNNQISLSRYLKDALTDWEMSINIFRLRTQPDKKEILNEIDDCNKQHKVIVYGEGAYIYQLIYQSLRPTLSFFFKISLLFLMLILLQLGVIVVNFNLLLLYLLYFLLCSITVFGLFRVLGFIPK